MSVIRSRNALVALVALTACGCFNRQLPDPNNAEAGSIDPTALQSDLKGITDLLAVRRSKNEISEAEFTERIVEGANDLVERGKIDKVRDEDAWRYAEVLRAAHLWAKAETYYRQAVKWANANNVKDRHVNDTLHLAQTIANQGRQDEAIVVARSVFNSQPVDAAPILISTRLEIVPPLEGKGKDIDLARLLMDAASIRVKVDRRTPEGRLFVQARTYHVKKALDEAMTLFDKAGKHDEGQEALKLYLQRAY